MSPLTSDPGRQSTVLIKIRGVRVEPVQEEDLTGDGAEVHEPRRIF